MDANDGDTGTAASGVRSKVLIEKVESRLREREKVKQEDAEEQPEEEKAYEEKEEEEEEEEEVPSMVSKRTTGRSTVISEAIRAPWAAKITANFFSTPMKAEQEKPLPEFPCQGVLITNIRYILRRLMHNAVYDALSGAVVLLDIYAGMVEIDERASGVETPAAWISLCGYAFFTVYALELLASVLIKWREALHDVWVIMDALVVFSAALDYIIQSLSDPGSVNMGLLRFFRVTRIAKILKLLGKFKSVRELRKLIRMTLSCFLTLFWSFLFCFAVMNFWSMCAVDLLRGYVKELDEQGVFENCADCSTAFDSVMNANLFFYKTIIASEGWGQLEMPLIQNYWASGIILIGAHLSITYAILNLIVAIIVDEFAEARSQDEMMMAEEMDIRATQDRARLTTMFKTIDKDGSGEIDLEELMQAAETVPSFAHRLRVMDIDRHDLEQLFILLDDDESGTISSQEFIDALNRWMHDSKTAARFVKHEVALLHEEQTIMRADLALKLETLSDDICRQIDTRLDSLKDWQRGTQFGIPRGADDMATASGYGRGPTLEKGASSGISLEFEEVHVEEQDSIESFHQSSNAVVLPWLTGNVRSTDGTGDSPLDERRSLATREYVARLAEGALMVGSGDHRDKQLRMAGKLPEADQKSLTQSAGSHLALLSAALDSTERKLRKSLEEVKMCVLLLREDSICTVV
eukprot:TRINITY_DN22514_c0_g1_i1.p1 TRINITY_DN22514_c0_g1~~TRINITY_DN22514_c0_g1_i1.p1  ORF type:complete len:694 (-),score=128.10 TRINITY_DN22514_c0_g1_i1:315-2396(-)